jgi:hypothetical protein
MHRRRDARWQVPRDAQWQRPPIRPLPYQPPPMHGYRHPPRYRSRRRGMWVVVRHVPPPLLVVLGIAAVGVIMAMLAALMSVGMVIGAIAVPVLVTRSVIRSRARQRRLLAAAAHPMPHAIRPPAPRPIADPWPTAKNHFARLSSEYAAYECDALAVLRLPALADVTIPSTARFVEAFAEAQALDTDAPPPPAHRDKYVAAVERAWRAWLAAREAAERIRHSHLPEEERSTVDRVVRLLTTARDTDNDAERLVAYGKARSELAKLERGGRLRIPRPAQAQLDNAYRGQLPA